MNFIILSCTVIFKINLLDGTGLTFVLLTFFTLLVVHCLCSILLHRNMCATVSTSVGWTYNEPQFDSKQEEERYFFSKVSKTALGPTNSAVQWVLGALSTG